MSYTKESIKTLLEKTDKTILHSKEIEKIKGEQFNIFSILKMESSETKTHSNFIAELLNPKGTHLKGDIFLNLFLKAIYPNHLDVSTTTVQVEKYVGKVNNKKNEGGRIDIYLKDIKGNSISIENKIFAGDQKNQLKRYANHNKEKNKVFYLTLEGDDASEFSKGKEEKTLILRQEYYLISYKEDILDWLEACHKESVDAPILRESIRQYIILIQKLTHTMDNTFEKEINKLIVNNLESALHIRSVTAQLLEDTRENFRLDIIEKINNFLKKKGYELEATVGSKKTSVIYSQIWISSSKKNKDNFLIGIETFSGWARANLKGELFIGVFKNRSVKTDSKIEDKGFNPLGSGAWIDHKPLVDPKGSKIILTKKESLLQILDKESDEYKKMCDVVMKQIIDYLNKRLDIVMNANFGVN